MANPAAQEADDIASVKNQLVDFVKRGEAIFPVSMFHVLETIHMTKEHREFASKRALVAKEISNGHAFSWIADVFLYDALKLLDVTPPDIVASVVSHFGSWLPLKARISIFDLVGTVRKELKSQLLATGATRTERRLLLKRAFKGDRLHKRFLPLLENAIDAMHEQMKVEFPLTERFHSEKMFGKLVCGNISELEFCEELERGFRDPEHFVRWYADLVDPERSVIGGLRKISSRVAKCFRLFKLLAEGENLTPPKIKQLVSDYPIDTHDFRSRLLNDMFTNHKELLRKNNISNHQWNELVVNTRRGDVLGIDAFLNLLRHIYEAELSRVRSSFTQESTIADMMHGLYLPYVDLFRADRAFSHQLRNAFPKDEGKVVSKLLDLPKAIERLLDSQCLEQVEK